CVALRLRACRGGLEFQRDTVHAVALSGRLRPVVEHVAEMAAAAPAVHLGAWNDQAVIVRSAHRILDRRKEARPAGAALDLGLGPDQRQIAPGAAEDARPMLVVERARMRPLRPVLAQPPELLRAQDLLPFRFRSRDLEFLAARLRLAAAEQVFGKGGYARQAHAGKKRVSSGHHPVILDRKFAKMSVRRAPDAGVGSRVPSRKR